MLSTGRAGNKQSLITRVIKRLEQKHTKAMLIDEALAHFKALDICRTARKKELFPDEVYR